MPRWASAGTSPRCGAPGSARSDLAHARTLPELEDAPGLSLPLADAVSAALARLDVDAAAAADLSHGRPLPAAGMSGTYGVFAPDGRVLALVTERDGAARPLVVLAPASG